MEHGTKIIIGPWRFDAAGALLIGPHGEHRLEDRAARTLAMLARLRGDAVTQAAILAEVWQGRTVSAGSVAVVMRDLRRALEDDARNPRFIITVPKRGYRLVPEPASPRPAIADGAVPNRPEVALLHRAVADLPGSDRASSYEAASEGAFTDVVGEPAAGALRPPHPDVAAAKARRGAWAQRVFLAGSAAAALALLATAGVGKRAGHPAPLTVEPVSNDTGNAAYGPLSIALSRLVVTHLAHIPTMSVVEGGATPVPLQPSDLVLRASLILWNGEPTLSLTETNMRSGEVIWAGMAEGPESALSGNTVKALRELGARPAV